LILRGVAFRSSRAEPFGEHFLRRAIRRLLVGDVPAVRDLYLETLDTLRARGFPTHNVSSRVRLTKSPQEYAQTRDERRELPYEAMLASGRSDWEVGERVRVYRTRIGYGRVAPGEDDHADPRDYDVDHYARVLRDTFAARFERAFASEDFAALFADPDQLTLFAPPIETIRPILRSVTALGQSAIR
jgi:hypothetical protein